MVLKGKPSARRPDRRHGRRRRRQRIATRTSKVIERSACPTCGSCSGMFTANSMNCLTEALGLSLPGNGSMLATHADRESLFREAGRLDRRSGQRWYEQDDATVLPRNIASFERLRERHERSTSPWAARPTPCCICWPRRRRRRSISPWPTSTGCRAACPCLCKVAPAKADVHMEDVHRAGGIMAILGELDRAGLIDRDAADRACADAGRRARHAGTSARTHQRGGRANSTAPRPAACRRRSPSARPPLGRAGHRPRERRDPRRRARLLARTAGWRCCSATSRPTAAS